MRQKFLYLVVVAVIAMAASWNVSRSMSEEALLSDVALANVEALAQSEEPSYRCTDACHYDPEWVCTIYYSNGNALYCDSYKGG